jgi:hypothetical protein
VKKMMLGSLIAAAALLAATFATVGAAKPKPKHGKKGPHGSTTQVWKPVVESCGTAAPTGAQGTETGPGTPPAGNGSYFFQIGSNGDTYRTLRSNSLAGVPLSQLTTLSYWTYVTAAPGQQAVYIDLYIDNNGDGVKDDTLTFEPVYQSTPVASNTWQQWNALTGLWWAESSGGPPPLFTLSSYSSTHPNARIVTDQPGFLLSAGCGGAAWTNFDGNVDLVRVGVNGKLRTYNFERAKPPKPPKDDHSSDDGSDDGSHDSGSKDK